VILSDSHDMIEVGKAGGTGRLMQASWHGFSSEAFATALHALEPLVWREA